MKKLILLSLTIIIFASCYVGASASCNHVWQREKYGDREYNDTYHYACYECQECYENKYELEVHDFENIPYTYRYWNKDTCNAEYRCKSCGYEQSRPTTHNWKPSVGEYDYNSLDNTYHEKSREYTCTKCDHIEYFGQKEKHSYKYHNLGNIIYYRCSVCRHDYGDKFILSRGTLKSTLKKGKKKNITISKSGLPNDTIKKFKVLSGKKATSLTRKSSTKIVVKAKKKGTTKIKLFLKSGAVYIFIVKVK